MNQLYYCTLRSVYMNVASHVHKRSELNVAGRQGFELRLITLENHTQALFIEVIVTPQGRISNPPISAVVEKNNQQ